MLEVPPTYLEVPQKAITEETNGPPPCSNQLLTGNPYMSCFKYIQIDVPKSQIHRYKECKYKITQIQDMASLNCLQNTCLNKTDIDSPIVGRLYSIQIYTLLKWSVNYHKSYDIF